MEDGWFIKRGADREGPLTADQLKAFAVGGQLRRTDRIARPGMKKWAEAKSIDGLFPAADSAIPVEIVPSPTTHPEQSASATSATPVNSAVVLSQRTALPWILAGVAGGGVLVLCCSGLLCAGLLLLTSKSSEESNPMGSTIGTTSAAASTVAGDGTEAIAIEEPVSDDETLTVMQGLLDALKQQGGGANSELPAEVAAVVAKANGGDVESMHELGYRFSEGDDVEVDYPEAVRWYRKAADAGHPQAMNDLAYSYMKGLGVEKDQEAGAALFRQAAEAGSGMGMFNYAICLGNGVGVDQNDYLSRLWIQKSAESGYEPAQKYMADAQAQMKAEIFGAIVGSFFGGGQDSDEGADDTDSFTDQRRQREYWEDRARREAAAGNQDAADWARRQAP